MTNALQRLATAKPIQPKLSLPAKQNEPSVFDPRLNVSVAGRINPKEALGKLPTVLKEQAAKLPGSGTPLDQARVGKDLASRQQGSKALEQRMKDGSGLGRSDSLGLVEPASKLAKDDILNKPDGRAPQARVGGVQQRDQKNSVSGDSFLMGRSDEHLVHRDEQQKAAIDAQKTEQVLVLICEEDRQAAIKTEQQRLTSHLENKEIYTDVALAAGVVGAASAIPNPPLAAAAGAAGVAASVAARSEEKNAAKAQKRLEFLEGSAPLAPCGDPLVQMPSPEEGSGNPELAQRLRDWVNPNNKGLTGGSVPLVKDSLVNPDRTGEFISAAPGAPAQSFFASVDHGVICPGPDQFKALVSPGQVDFLTGAFQQKTDALINPARNDDGSVGGPTFGAPGRVSAGQAGFNAISTDGLSERNVADFVLTQGAAAHGFQSISTDGLSERPVVGFSLGQVPSAANGFQAISTDGLSERNGVGQAFMAATQGSASADPFAPATPITPVF